MNDPHLSPRESGPESPEEIEPWTCGSFGCAGMALILCALLGMVLGYAGAILSGLRSYGSFDIRPLLHLCFGAISGGGLFLILVPLFRRGEPMERISKAAACALIGSFLSGLVGYQIAEFDASLNQKRDRRRAQEETSRYNECHRQLKENPAVALTEKWYLHSSKADGAVRYRAYKDSLENPYVPYTAEVLHRLLDMETMKGDSETIQMILRHPNLDPRLLEHEYRRALEALPDKRLNRRRPIGAGKDSRTMIAILSNPQAKEEWFDEVAASGAIEGDTTLWKENLRRTIEKERTNK